MRHVTETPTELIDYLARAYGTHAELSDPVAGTVGAQAFELRDAVVGLVAIVKDQQERISRQERLMHLMIDKADKRNRSRRQPFWRRRPLAVVVDGRWVGPARVPTVPRVIVPTDVAPDTKDNGHMEITFRHLAAPGTAFARGCFDAQIGQLIPCRVAGDVVGAGKLLSAALSADQTMAVLTVEIPDAEITAPADARLCEVSMGFSLAAPHS